MITKTGAFCDDRCTCPVCGNTPSMLGGKGYDIIQNDYFAGERGGSGEYIRTIRCRECGAKSVYQDKD